MDGKKGVLVVAAGCNRRTDARADHSGVQTFNALTLADAAESAAAIVRLAVEGKLDATNALGRAWLTCVGASAGHEADGVGGGGLRGGPPRVVLNNVDDGDGAAAPSAR